MESKRINWNRILKSAIAGIGFTLVCLLIGIFAIIPLTKVSAIDVVWDYNAMKNSERIIELLACIGSDKSFS